jgi:arabinogalactan oligomer/maltooligosaccharide transport system permease protein
MQRLFLALFALLVAVLPGCGDDRPSLVVWHSMRGDQETAFVELAKRYEAERGVRVELLSIPFDAFSAKLEAAVPHAHGPDLFVDAHERLGSYKKNAIVAPAGDAVPASDQARYDATALRAVTLDGVVYAVPMASKCLALYLNTRFVSTAPQALEDLAALRDTLPKDVYPLAYPTDDPYFHAPFLHAFGGAMLDGEKFGMAGPDAARSIELVRELTKKGVVPVEPDGALVTRLFGTGQAAAAIGGPWLASDLKTDVKYKVVPLPYLAETSRRMRPYLTVDGLFLTPQGAQRAEARAFARWVGDVPAAKLRATVGKQAVATLAAWDDPEVARDELLAAFHSAALEAEPMPTSTAMRATWVPAQQAIRKVLRGDAQGMAALDEARARFADAMRPPPPPPSPAPLVLVAGVLLLAAAIFAVRRARDPSFRKRLSASKPAYKYVAHAALTVAVLVVLPIVAGALTSFFVGTRDAPRFVGLGNYVEILTARGGPLLASRSFYLTLLVTVAWTVVNVTLHVAFGLVLGVALSQPLVKLRGLWRVLLILPWAVPSYVTALAWKGMFHRQFGAINAILGALGAEPISWFSKWSTAFAANVSTNVWLGFPFMMVVVLGALTSIPRDVLEAAEVDGATRWQRFRLVTLPLLKPSLLPAVVLGCVWTFNMFNVVFLVSGGEPDETTDILVSEAYRWAFTRDAQYGYAAAYAVLIFFILVAGSRLLSRIAGQKEEGFA